MASTKLTPAAFLKGLRAQLEAIRALPGGKWGDKKKYELWLGISEGGNTKPPKDFGKFVREKKKIEREVPPGLGTKTNQAKIRALLAEFGGAWEE